MHQPQSAWLRRALFQAHLWSGVGLGLYVAVVSLSGSLIIFRRSLDRALCPRTVLVAPLGRRRLGDAALAAAASATFRRFPLRRIEVRGPRVPGAAVEVWLIGQYGRDERLLDPYTGRYLGDAVACEPAAITGLADLHDELLGGLTGERVNGVGAVLLVLMALTGLVLWWPGRARWWHSLVLHRHTPRRRFLWELHGVLGFWLLLPMLLWAVSGFYLAFPGPFNALTDLLLAHGARPAVADRIDAASAWLVRVHFGRAFGLPFELAWAALGLAPCVMAATGVLMWYQRVLRRRIGRARDASAAPAAVGAGGEVQRPA